jgi:UDPglucose 6-dehydrogenase
VFLSYDTPVLDDDSSDTSILENTVSDLAAVMKNGSILVVSSQSPVGFCRTLRESLRKKNESLELAYSPENLRLGEAIACYLHPERIILGTASAAAEKACLDLFSPLSADVLTMGLESAEMVKHGINSFLATSIVFANQLSDLCEKTGARIDDVIRGMKSDPRIGSRAYLAPGIGFSGGTLGRDLKVLEKAGADDPSSGELFGTIHRLNHSRKHRILRRIRSIGGPLDGKKIGILGVTYKPGTSTLRRSLPLEIADLLIENGAEVAVFDPKADYTELTTKPLFIVAQTVEALSESAEMLVLLTEWKDFNDVAWTTVARKMSHPVFFDAKNFLDGEAMRLCGFKYHCIGRSD